VRCVGQASADGLPSYVEALECILVTVNVSNDSATAPQDIKKEKSKKTGK
jgi:hypothetical protein